MEPISKITNEKKDYLGFSWIFVVHVCFKKGLLILEQIFALPLEYLISYLLLLHSTHLSDHCSRTSPRL